MGFSKLYRQGRTLLLTHKCRCRKSLNYIATGSVKALKFLICGNVVQRFRTWCRCVHFKVQPPVVSCEALEQREAEPRGQRYILHHVLHIHLYLVCIYVDIYIVLELWNKRLWTTARRHALHLTISNFSSYFLKGRNLFISLAA